MALTDPPDTLAFHTSRVLTSNRDMSGVQTSAVAARTKAFLDSDLHKQTKPETEALWFYGLNHGMSLIQAEFAPLQPLPGGINEYVDQYHSILGPKALRAFYYLLLICTREFRHCKSIKKDAPKIKQQFGDAIGDFFTSINGGEAEIHKALLDTPPAGTIGAYTKALQWGFYNGTWGGGYGGPAWGAVTDCLVRFVHGEFTAEMMLDTVWTLCHNNGPIFNKGICYATYGSYIVRILDIQRSGQIPEAVFSDQKCKGYVVPDLLDKMHYIDAIFPGKLGKYVDWYQVEALGAVETYPMDKELQNKKHGLSPKASELEKLAEAKAKADAAAEAKAKAEYAENHFEVMPGLVVKKFKPVRTIAA